MVFLSGGRSYVLVVGRSVVGLGRSLRGGSEVAVANGVGEDNGRGEVRGLVGRTMRGLVGVGGGGAVVVVTGAVLVVTGVVVGRSSTENTFSTCYYNKLITQVLK